MSTMTSRGRISKIRPLTMLPSRKSGIGFDIKSCICTIVKKASLALLTGPTQVGLNSVPTEGPLSLSETEGHSSRFPGAGQLSTGVVSGPKIWDEQKLVPPYIASYEWRNWGCVEG